MKRTLLYIYIAMTLTGIVSSVRASVWNTTTIDPGTLSAMEATYQSQAVIETRTADSLARIRKTYTDIAALTSTGIYMSKYLDQKGLRDIEFWNDSRENYYYKKIYNTSYSILVRIVRVAGMCLKEPGSSLYWGSYLMKACSDVQSLCSQFQTLATNCTLSFEDLPFLNFSTELQSIFNLANLNGNDFEAIFDNFVSNLGGSFTKENISADWQNLRDFGVDLAMSGVTSETQALMQGTGLDNDSTTNLASFITLLDNISEMASAWSNPKEKLLNIIGENADVENLFELGNYNITRWLSDIALSTQNRYYTQTVRIVREASSKHTILCNYQPPWDEQEIIYGEHWYRINTTDRNYTPNSVQKENILENSEICAGWNRSRVEELNNAQNGYVYDMDYDLKEYALSKPGVGYYAKAFAYSIVVSRDIDKQEYVYEATFDSKTMDWNTFNKQMQQLLKEYQEGYYTDSADSSDEEGGISYQYRLEYGEKRMYEGIDEASLEQATAVMINAKCSDDVEIAEGNCQWKCGTCESDLTHHAHTCSMYTTIPPQSINLKDFEDTISELQQTILELQQKKAKLTDMWTSLYKESQGFITAAQRESIRRRMAEIDRERYAIQDQIDDYQKQLEEVKESYREAQNDESASSDDYERMPYIMNTLASHYNLQWLDAGKWEGNNFVREAKQYGKGDYIITFTGKLRLIRKAKYLLGIGWKPLKIHQAIIGIDWSLKGHGETTTTVATVQIQKGEDLEVSKRIINEKMEEVAQEFPDCSIELKYIYPDNPPSEDVGEDKHHLLWHADRLEIARNIEIKLLYLNSELIMLERYLHYRHSILDWLVDNSLNRIHGDRTAESSRKAAIASRCRNQWMKNGGSNRYEVFD